MVIGAAERNGMVETSHPLAAETRDRVLQNGGSAADVAVAVAAELAFVEPHMTTLGGDIVVLTHFDGEFRASFGVMGGSMMPQGHLQLLVTRSSRG